MTSKRKSRGSRLGMAATMMAAALLGASVVVTTPGLGEAQG